MNRYLLRDLCSGLVVFYKRKKGYYTYYKDSYLVCNILGRKLTTALILNDISNITNELIKRNIGYVILENNNILNRYYTKPFNYFLGDTYE